MNRRAAALAGLALCCLAAALPRAAAAATPAGPQLRISAIRLSTVGGHVLRAAPGATVQSCASDPVYSVTFAYRWARMGIPGKELLRLDAPGTQGDVRSRTSLFEARGTNELVEAAEEFGVGSRALPAGAYRFEAKLDGVARTAAVTVTAAGC